MSCYRALLNDGILILRVRGPYFIHSKSLDQDIDHGTDHMSHVRYVFSSISNLQGTSFWGQLEFNSNVSLFKVIPEFRVSIWPVEKLDHWIIYTTNPSWFTKSVFL